MALRVLSVTSELYPLIKTGGLADVAGALPAALRQEGILARTLMPGYPAVLDALDAAEQAHLFDGLPGGAARLLAGRAAGLELLVLDAPQLFGRPGNPYQASPGVDWADNGVRFAALGQAAARIALGAWPGFVPDILHAHDWQAGLAPAYLRYAGGRRPGTVMTVHNLAYQGRFPRELMAELGFPPSAFAIEGIEYYGGIGFLKAGLWSADRITTVSPGYAMEIQTDEGGMGLGGLLRSRAAVLSGILNGIDETVWNPDSDPHLPQRYDAASAATARAANKAALQARFGIGAYRDVPLFGVISRLEWQKGLDLLLDCLPALLLTGGQLVVLGAGAAALQEGFIAAQRAHPGRVGVVLGYDEGLAHLIQGGSDAILVPSRFEPCGLTQLCALRYGAIPIVARVGGLADTVIDANEAAVAAGVATGVQFHPVTAERLGSALVRTVKLWRNPPEWRRMQQNAMRAPVGWTRPAAQYAALYRDLARSVPAGQSARA